MEQVEVITREEFAYWKENKVTKVITEMLLAIREQQIEFLADGGTVGDSEVSTETVVGLIKGLNAFLEVEVEEEVSSDDYNH